MVITVSPADGSRTPMITASDPVEQMALAPDGQLLALSLANGQIEVWDLTTETLVSSWQPHTDTPSALAFPPSGTTLITASGDGTIILWQAP